MSIPSVKINRNYINAVAEVSNRSVIFQASDCSTDGRLLVKRCNYEGHSGSEQKVYEPCDVTRNLSLSGTSLDTIQDIATDSSPTFAGLTITGDIEVYDDSWIGLGAAAGRLVFDNLGTDEIRIEDANFDLNGNDLLLDSDGDSYIHASADDVIDLVLAGAGGEFGITINGAEDFTFTANTFTGAAGSSMVMDTMTIATGSITDSTGAIDFGNENLTTTGVMTANRYVTAGDIGIAANTDLLQLTNGVLVINGRLGLNITPDISRIIHCDRAGVTDCNIQLTNATTGHALNNGLYFGISAAGHSYFWNYGAFELNFGTNNIERWSTQANGEVRFYGNTVVGKDTAALGKLTVINQTDEGALSECLWLSAGGTNAGDGPSMIFNNYYGAGAFTTWQLAEIGASWIGGGGWGGQIQFLTNDNSAAAAVREVWRMTYDGHLQAQLDSTYLNLGASQDSGITDDGSDMIIDFDLNGAGGGRDLLIQNNGTDIIVVQNDGDVGFGITPTVVFDVSRNQNARTYCRVVNTNNHASATASWYAESNGNNIIGIYAAPPLYPTARWQDKGILWSGNNSGMVIEQDGAYPIDIYRNNTQLFGIDGNGLISYNNATIHAIAQTGAPTSTTAGALWLDTNAGANGTLKCYANGAWRTVQAL